jgi:chlorite dismutase
MTYHNYIFFRIDKTIHTLSKQTVDTYKTEFIKKITTEKQVITYSYTTLGLKGHTVFALWLQANDPIHIQNFLNTLLHTSLGKYLIITQTLFGMTRPTQYSPGSVNHTDTVRKGGQYLIVYPFTKTQAWYMLDLQKRKELMKGHIAIGRKYPQITQILLYSYGVDDQEFIVSYETDSLPEFQQLVMELRSDEVRNYTLKDTPLFLCVFRSFTEAMDFL